MQDLYDYDWYRIIDGVVYNLKYDWHENSFSYAVAFDILIDDPDAKVTISGPITVSTPDGDEYILPVSVDLGSVYPPEVGEIEIGDGVTSLYNINKSNSLKKVTIGKDVGNINNCFYGCPNLEVVIDEENKNLERVGNSIYRLGNDKYDRKQLITVIDPPEHYELENDVTSYEKAIQDSTGKSIKINSNLYGFVTGETYLKKIRISNNVTSINVFDISNSRVKNLDLSNIKMIWFKAEKATKLKSIVLPKIIKKIEDYGFRGTKKLRYIEIPDTIQRLKYRTFLGSGISEILLSENLDIIRTEAFKNCKNLKKVTFKGSKIKKIEKKAFKGTPSGIKFYTPDTKTAKKLKNKLAGTGVKNAKIYANNKLIYKNVK